MGIYGITWERPVVNGLLTQICGTALILGLLRAAGDSSALVRRPQGPVMDLQRLSANLGAPAFWPDKGTPSPLNK